MPDNVNIRDGDNTAFQAATDLLADNSQSPKVSLLDGTGSATPISPATSGNQSTLNTNVGATNETAPATDTATSGLNGRLQRIAQRITSLIALLPASLGQKAKSAALAVTLASDEDLLGIQKRAAAFARVSAQYTRPANTTAYAANGSVGTTHTFSGAANSSGGQGRITGAWLTHTTTTITNSDFTLYLYEGAPGSAPGADQTAWASTHLSDRTTYVGSIRFRNAVAGNSNGIISEGELSRAGMMFDIVSGTDLIGVLVANAAYVPGSSETFYMRLDIEQGK